LISDGSKSSGEGIIYTGGLEIASIFSVTPLYYNLLALLDIIIRYSKNTVIIKKYNIYIYPRIRTINTNVLSRLMSLLSPLPQSFSKSNLKKI